MVNEFWEDVVSDGDILETQESETKLNSTYIEHKKRFGRRERKRYSFVEYHIRRVSDVGRTN